MRRTTTTKPVVTTNVNTDTQVVTFETLTASGEKKNIHLHLTIPAKPCVTDDSTCDYTLLHDTVCALKNRVDTLLQ